ncbi:MAG: hypothetical protein JST91_10140 [Actinobacteria bacterium]|nr:hypothetical protein [Actinomycetota bacterium]
MRPSVDYIEIAGPAALRDVVAAVGGSAPAPAADSTVEIVDLSGDVYATVQYEEVDLDGWPYMITVESGSDDLAPVRNETLRIVENIKQAGWRFRLTSDAEDGVLIADPQPIMTCPSTNFTPLDSLKECAVRANLTLANAIELLGTPGALALPDAIATLTGELAELHEVLCVESIRAHVDADSSDGQTFSDGRPVGTRIQLEPGVQWVQPWSADPNSARDQPQIVRTIRTQSNTLWRIVILRAGELHAVQLEETLDP